MFLAAQSTQWSSPTKVSSGLLDPLSLVRLVQYVLELILLKLFDTRLITKVVVHVPLL